MRVERGAGIHVLVLAAAWDQQCPKIARLMVRSGRAAIAGAGARPEEGVADITGHGAAREECQQPRVVLGRGPGWIVRGGLVSGVVAEGPEVIRFTRHAGALDITEQRPDAPAVGLPAGYPDNRPRSRCRDCAPFLRPGIEWKQDPA